MIRKKERLVIRKKERLVIRKKERTKLDIDIRHGDCLTVLRDLSDSSVDSVVTDPPYGLSNTTPPQVADVLAAWVTGDTEAVPTKRGGFMGKDWDSFVPPPAVWAECLRVLKPGGHLAVFAGSRTQDLMGLSIRLAGFEIRDTLGWIYGSGFPKSMDVSKAIGKNTGEGREWDGWGTALKPAIEPIILARKPLDGTVAANVLAHGVGGLNIDASRVPIDGGEREVIDNRSGAGFGTGETVGKNMGRAEGVFKSHAQGRFPANVLLDEHAAAEMDEQSGVSVSRANTSSDGRKQIVATAAMNPGVGRRDQLNSHTDSGGASRFFPVFKYQAKAPKKERPVIVREDGTKIAHPTVKPVALMEWLVTLITPKGGTTLDPFAGTGTTLQAARNKGFAAIGVEQDKDYIALIEQRLSKREKHCKRSKTTNHQLKPRRVQ